ncbi:MAG: hypothetical protein M3340_17755 [Actinomycetota bacterium]|nr:hypothetical protein [Actinomycetota bacterium]
MTLVERVLDAHGGLDAWRAHDELELRYRAGGLAFASRMRGLRMKPWHARVRLDRPHTILEDYPERGRRGVLDGEHVSIEGDGARDNPRELFRSARRRVRWDDLDLLYFSGYAIWGYATFPFHLTLPGVEATETGDRTLHVRYPAGWPVHSREQTFHFDDQHLLVRNDYTAEVIGSWAHAVHLTLEHRTFDGLTFGTRRRVHPRATAKISLVKIAIDEVEPR